MSDDTEPDLSVGEFVEYCRTQAGLLSGQVETMGEEADELLDEIEETVADIRSRLEEQQGANTKGTATPTSTADPGAEDVDVEDVEEMAADLEEKQTIVEAKQARMQAFQELAADYTELAEGLQSDADDGREAMTRVVEFELDRDAPAYFDERQTLAEAAAEATESDDSEPTEAEPE